MGFFKSPESPMTEAMRLAEELRDLWRQKRALNLQKPHAAAEQYQGATTENWTLDDTQREKIFDQKIAEIKAKLTELGIDVPDPTL